MNRPTTKTDEELNSVVMERLKRFEQGLGFHVAKRFVRNVKENGLVTEVSFWFLHITLIPFLLHHLNNIQKRAREIHRVSSEFARTASKIARTTF